MHLFIYVHNWNLKQNIWDKIFNWMVHATTTLKFTCNINIIYKLPTLFILYVVTILLTTNVTNKIKLNKIHYS
jgi:hypothetical protein